MAAVYRGTKPKRSEVTTDRGCSSIATQAREVGRLPRLRSRLTGALLIALSTAIVATAHAQAAKTDPINAATNAWVDVGALISARYTYSFQRPKDDRIADRVLDKKDNTFAIDTAALFISRDREGEGFGFHLAFDFFDGAKYTASRQGYQTKGDNYDGTDEFEVREAYLTYDVPFHDITVKAGKFTTLLGYEVLKTPTNINHNVSHSLLFGFAIPFTHTGILANIPLTDIVSVDVGVVNGWDNVADNNAGKTLLAGLGIYPVDEFSLYASGTFGPEQDDNHDSNRGVLSMNAVYRPAPGLSLVWDGVYGNESSLPDASGSRSAADWYGMALYAIGDVGDFSITLRGEVLYDQIAPGVRDNFGPGASGDRVTVWEISPAVAYQFNSHLTARIEYRHDEASDRIFLQRRGNDGGWNTIAAELVGRL